MARDIFERACAEAARVAALEMRAHVPRDRGRLRASFRSVGDTAFSTAKHAWFVQWGTRYMRGRHFVEPAIEAGLAALERVLTRGT